MDYQVVFSPELEVSSESFILAWNDDPECRDIALAEPQHESPAGFPIDPGAALVFLGGVATTLATGVITNLVTKWIEKQFSKTPSEPPPHIEVMVIQQAPGACLLVVTPPES